MSDPCKIRFTTWIDQKIGGAMLGEVVVAAEHDAALAREAALREELAQSRILAADQALNLKRVKREFESMRDRKNSIVDLQQRLTAAEQRNAELADALLKIIEMNRQHAKDQYGDPSKAESWACIRVARAALKPTESGASG